MFPVWKEIFPITEPKNASEDTHKGENVSLFPVWKVFYSFMEPEQT
jgi:hypothetical protein